jgi:hypothetical protein
MALGELIKEECVHKVSIVKTIGKFTDIDLSYIANHMGTYANKLSFFQGKSMADFLLMNDDVTTLGLIDKFDTYRILMDTPKERLAKLFLMFNDTAETMKREEIGTGDEKSWIYVPTGEGFLECARIEDKEKELFMVKMIALPYIVDTPIINNIREE